MTRGGFSRVLGKTSNRGRRKREVRHGVQEIYGKRGNTNKDSILFYQGFLLTKQWELELGKA